MKMTTPDTIDAQVLLQRVAHEIGQLTRITDRLQVATYDLAKAAGPEHISTFQDLDRLHQSLGHLSDFIGSLATALPQVCHVDAKRHVEGIKLVRLGNALLGNSICSSITEEDGEFELLQPLDAPSHAEYLLKVS